MPNRLIHETSPYLLQHAGNPVDWYAWGDEALNKAREEKKPIFLSIGYAACHWCHVMEHESFEDPQTASLLNEHFVSIKVDREERPDLDSIYMNAVVAMTGQGGWPMSVFLTPEGEPFFCGTYFPATRRYGMPSFREVLVAVAKSWQEENEEIHRVGHEIAQHLRESSALDTGGATPITAQTLQEASATLLKTYDWQMGGWGHAPRFPQPMAIEFLLLQATRGDARALDAASHVLRLMSRGGMYDAAGGGFHRYSTDNDWLVPHFEKMLYDNGQLALAYLHAYLLTARADFLQVTTGTLDFLLREMRHPQGGFYSSLDADSEGAEGKYYIWTVEEIQSAIAGPADRELFHRVYPVTPRGNFEGKNILHRTDDLDALAGQVNLSTDALIQRLAGIHQQLLAAREKRVRPLTDDKVLVSWNALAIRALAQAARYLRRADYLKAAQDAAGFILREMIVEGRLLRAWRNGHARHNGYLEDYAGLILALIDLYQADHDPRWYTSASQLALDMLAHFADPQGGFFDTRDDHGELITRPKDVQDNATPSGNALAAAALLHLAAYDEQADWQASAEKMTAELHDLMVKHPTAFGYWLQNADFITGPVRQVAVIGEPDAPETLALLETISQVYRPRMVTAVAASGTQAHANDTLAQVPDLLQGRGMLGGKPTVYVCQGFTCNLPVNSAEALKEQLA